MNLRLRLRGEVGGLIPRVFRYGLFWGRRDGCFFFGLSHELVAAILRRNLQQYTTTRYTCNTAHHVAVQQHRSVCVLSVYFEGHRAEPLEGLLQCAPKGRPTRHGFVAP